ncbi:hypothetical protein BDN72DRAFT_824209 [Pluteus cervinus]|uniref:Uncharacterized protein n=1 Tax=Pluteus cervinus TaxID=181527 RepID=A0ACD3AIN4_9AGAR|nr:hypothetical protein BDN72DRAFT_824209 [Pluteus cervinus]
MPLSSGLAIDSSTVGAVVSEIAPRCDCSGTGADGRTLYDIVKSCLFTIAACVYRAVHQNIPDPELGFWGRLRVTTKVTFYALIAPELVIWWAMRQWFGARRVVRLVKSTEPTELNWTNVHGQFAQMGGFARKDNKQVLYPYTLRQLLTDGLLDVEELQLTENEIRDKSKGDILSKSLVAFQTTWFVFECIARLQKGLPLIELEVITLAFATLNIITYALWWYKPLNVLCPIYIHIRPPNPPTHSNVNPSPQVVEAASPSDVSVGNIVAGTSNSGKEAEVSETEGTNQAESGEGSGNPSKGIQPFVAVAWPLKELLENEGGPHEATHIPTFFAEWLTHSDEVRIQTWSSFIGMIFGAIHFISWDSTLPAHVELLLWRISSIILVVPPFLLLLRSLFLYFYWATFDPQQTRRAENLRWFFEKVSFFLGPIPYILARFCILVLAFITLNDLPREALTNVSWTSYIPHL